MKIVVVDDEFYARKALVKMLREFGGKFQVAADLETGKEAVEYIEQNPGIDAVITDIRMPEMDGIRLAEYLYRNYPEIQVIIETGYTDFEYAQEAIRYHVRDYITKPIHREELEKALENIWQEKLRAQSAAQRIPESAVEYSKEQLSIRELYENSELQKQFMPKCFDCFETMSYRILLLQVEGKENAEQKAELKAALERQAGTKLCEVFYFSGNREYVLLSFLEKDEAESGIHDEISDPLAAKGLRSLVSCANAVLDWGSKALGLSLSAAVSREHQGREEFYDAYKEAVYAINQRLLQGWNKVFTCERKQKEQHISSLDQKDEAALRQALGRSDSEGAKEVLLRILEDPELSRNEDIYELYKRIISVLGIFNQQYRQSDHGGDARMMVMFSRRYDLYNFRHMSELEDYLLDMIKQLCSQSQEIPYNGRDIIIEITEYISRSYQYDISLQDLAEKKYFMNVSYLSRLFKANVGKTFSKYLIEYRLEKSRELLEKTILKVSEIAVHVGYNDVSHFIQSFRKVYGMTPEEYRGNHGEREKSR